MCLDIGLIIFMLPSLLTNQKEYNRLKQVLVDRYIRNANALKKISEEFVFRKMHDDALMFLNYARTQSRILIYMLLISQKYTQHFRKFI